jgi:glucosamine-6-phosphate deaminase
MEIPFRISIFEEYCRAEEATAQQILEQVKQKRNSVIGLATGRTMRGVYRFLIDEEKKEPGLFKDVTFVQLDEIILKTVGEGIFSKELRELFIERLEGGYEAFLSINVFVEDMVKEAAEYLKKVLNAGGIDLQLLGIGVNGHIGYNEPGSERQSSCRVVS